MPAYCACSRLINPLFNIQMKKVQQTTTPNERITLNEWYQYIHNEVVRTKFNNVKPRKNEP